MRRYSDWVPRLLDALRAGHGRAYSPGDFDCCTAACGIAEAMTGADLMAPLRGYKTERGAAGKLARFAPRGTPPAQRLEAVADAITRDLGMPEVSVPRAQRGDLVLIMSPTPDGPRPALAIVDLSGCRVVTPAVDGGWATLPLAGALRAWRI